MLNYDISRMRHKADIGTIKSYEDDSITGYKEYFVPQLTVWAGEYTNTQEQTYDNLGSHIDVDLVLVIRHNPKVTDKKLLVRYKDTTYKITNINSDDRVNAFDTVTLKIDKRQTELLPSDTSNLGKPLSD